MRKKALLAMLLVMSLVLSGCALIQKDAAVDAAQEILKLGDQVYTKAQVQERVQSELETAALYNQLYTGRSWTSPMPASSRRRRITWSRPWSRRWR